jgi:hypothetical protein
MSGTEVGSGNAGERGLDRLGVEGEESSREALHARATSRADGADPAWVIEEAANPMRVARHRRRNSRRCAEHAKTSRAVAERREAEDGETKAKRVSSAPRGPLEGS